MSKLDKDKSDLSMQEPKFLTFTKPKQDSEKKKRRPVEIYSEKELTFPKFVRSDMSKFSARVIGVQKRVLSFTEYIVEINISNISPPMRRFKRYTEFRAFYKALKLRFENAGWPDFPPRIQFYKKIETRVTVFNQILDQIFETMSVGSTYKKSLLTIFYAFFLESGLEDTYRKVNKNTIYMNVGKKDTQQSEGSDNEDSINEEVLRMSILQFEKINHDENIDYDGEELEMIDADETHTQSNSFIGKKSFSEVTHKKKASLSLLHSKTLPEEVEVEDKKDLSLSQILLSSKENRRIEEQRGRKSPILPIIEKKPEVPEDIQDIMSIKDQSEIIEDKTPRGRKEVSPSISAVDSNNTSLMPARSRSALNRLKMSVNDETKSDAGKSTLSRKKGDTINKNKDNSQLLIDNPDFTKAKPVGKDKSCFSGLIYMRLSSTKRWHKYFAQVVKSKIILYDNVMVNKPNHFVFCYKCDLKYTEDPAGDYLEISHPHDSEVLYLATNLVNNPRKTMIEDDSTLEEWQAQLKIAREDSSDLDLIEDSYNPVGKLQLIISGAENLKKLQKNALYYINIQHMPCNLKTSPSLSENERINWNQSFFLPIFDTFFPIKLDLVCRYNSGWITDKKRDEVICSTELLMADILSMDSDSILKLKLPLKTPEIAKKPQADTPTMATNNKTKDGPPPELNIKIKNLSNYKSLFHPPTKEFIEGVRVDDEQFSRQLLKLGIRRVRRIITQTGFIFKEIDDIFHCKYPFFSFLCILLVSHLILAVDPSNMLSVLCLLLTLFGIYKNPKIEKKVDHFASIYFFSEDQLNTDYHKPRVQTNQEMIAKKDMQTGKWKYKLVDTDPLLLQYKKVKKSVIVFTEKLLKITGFIEKMKNILMWHDPIRTMWFIGFTFIAFFVFAVIPIRILLVIAVWAKLLKGVHFYRRRYYQNLALTKNTLKFITKKSFPNIYTQVCEKPHSPWPTQHFDSFQRRLVKELGLRLELNLADDTLCMFKTPMELIQGISTCSKFLKYKTLRNEGPIPNELKSKVSYGFVSRLLHFVMNVPSDYYRVCHPRSIDLFTQYREEPDNQIQNKPKMNKARNFEILLIIGFITLYELHIFFNFLF